MACPYPPAATLGERVEGEREGKGGEEETEKAEEI